MLVRILLKNQKHIFTPYFFAGDIEATAVMQGERYSVDGETYIKMKDLATDFSIGHASVHLTNLFDGDKQLGKYINYTVIKNTSKNQEIWIIMATQVPNSGP